MPDYGRLSIIPDFSLPSYWQLVRFLRDGGALVWFADILVSEQQFDGCHLRRNGVSWL